MYQLFFLSVATNLVAGYLLSHLFLREKIGALVVFDPEFLTSRTVYTVVGTLAVVVGALRIVFVTPGDVVVVGDLLPALSGLVAGVTLILIAYLERVDAPFAFALRLGGILGERRNTVGIVAIVIGVLHFFVPRLLFF